MSDSIRLQKYLAQCGVASRRGSEELIVQGKVEVNSSTVTVLGTKIDPLKDTVSLDGKRVQPEKLGLYKLHKSARVVSTMSDEHDRCCIADFVQDLGIQVFPVGRLDYDVTGLLLLTNDGDFAHKLLHPSFEVVRRYVARVKGHPSQGVLNRLVKGIELEDGLAKALNVSYLSPKDNLCRHVGPSDASSTAVCLEVKEGRNRFVKRVFEALEHPVLKLTRVKYGNFSLGNLGKGKIVEVPNYRNYAVKM